MKSFREFFEARARLGDIKDHPLYGKQLAQAIPVASVWQPHTFGQDVNEKDIESTLRKTVNQFGYWLDEGNNIMFPLENVRQLIDHNAAIFGQKYGSQNAEVFKTRAWRLYKNRLDAHKAFNK